MKTTAATPVDSTLKKLPEYPSLTVARPLPYVGPGVLTLANKASAKVDSVYPGSVGAGAL